MFWGQCLGSIACLSRFGQDGLVISTCHLHFDMFSYCNYGYHSRILVQLKIFPDEHIALQTYSDEVSFSNLCLLGTTISNSIKSCIEKAFYWVNFTEKILACLILLI